MQTKLFLKILLLRVAKFMSINASCNRLQPTVLERIGLVARGVYRGEFLKVSAQQSNFQELLDFSQLAQTIECNFLVPCELCNTLYSLCCCH